MAQEIGCVETVKGSFTECIKAEIMTEFRVGRKSVVEGKIVEVGGSRMERKKKRGSVEKAKRMKQRDGWSEGGERQARKGTTRRRERRG
ncbi:MAG: hypothetical protein AN485_24240, partial [Anabaena sp. MDT14b]